MCADRGKKHLYIIYIHTYIYARIYAISAWSSREQNQLKRRFKTCVCQNWFVSAPAKYPCSPALWPLIYLAPCTVPRFLSFPSSTDNSRHSVTCKKKKKKKKSKTQQQKHSTTAHCNWQTDSGTDRQRDRRTDAVTVGLAAVGQPHNTRWVSCTPTHTLRHTPAGGKQSQLGGCTRYQAGYPGMGAPPQPAPPTPAPHL